MRKSLRQWWFWRVCDFDNWYHHNKTHDTWFGLLVCDYYDWLLGAASWRSLRANSRKTLKAIKADKKAER